MTSKTENWITKIAVISGSMTAIIAPVVTTGACQTKSTSNNFKAISESKNENITTSLHLLTKLPYELNESGFLKLAMDALPKMQGITYNEAQVRNWYHLNSEKALNNINLINAHLRQRNFWDDLGNFFEGIDHGIATTGTAIATGFVEVANVVSGGALNDATHAMENLVVKEANNTASSFKEAFKNVNWEKVGLWAAEILRDASFLFGHYGTSILTQVIVDEIVHDQMPGRVLDELKTDERIQALAGIYYDDINKMTVSYYSDSQDASKNLVFKVTKSGYPPIASGTYSFKVSFDKGYSIILNVTIKP